MPLASSREASKKREAAVKVEKEREERRNRVSFPKSISSSTRSVTRESAKRRRTSRVNPEERSKKHVKPSPKEEKMTQNKKEPPKEEKEKQAVMSPEKKMPSSENPAPILSPTPYWKVAQERRQSKQFSPPMTRSTKKKNLKDRPSGNEAMGQIALTFSPPDQKENAKREKAELEAKTKDRDRRVTEQQQQKRLLIYDKNTLECRNFSFNDEEVAAAKGNDDTNQSHDSDTGIDGDDKQTSFELSQVSTGSNNTSDSQISDMSSTQHKADSEMREDIKAIKEKLELVVKDVDNKRSSMAGMQVLQEKEVLEAERAKNQELKAAKSTLESEVSNLQLTISENQKEFDAEKDRLTTNLEACKQDFSQKVEGLEGDLVAVKKDNSTLAKEVAALQNNWKETKTLLSENQAEKSTLLQQVKAESKAIQEECTKLRKELENVQGVKSRLEAEGKRMEVQLKKESADTKAELAKVQGIRSHLEAEVKRKEAELKEGLKVKDEELAKIQGDRSQLESKVKQMEAQMKEKDVNSQKQGTEQENEINDLMERNRVLQEEKDRNNDELRKMSEELNKMKQEKEDLHKKYKQTKETWKREKEEVSGSLDSLKNKLEEKLEELHQEREESREKSNTIAKLELALQKAKHRLSTSDDREDELLRKLVVSDNIRAALHNRVTQLSGNIRVFVRVRPSIPGEENRIAESEKQRNKRGQADAECPFNFPSALDASGDADDLTKRMIQIREPKKDRGGLSERRKQWRYPFDAVFSPDKSQGDVWAAVSPLVQSTIDGFPVCIFAYGQTGSGKTYTMLGEESNEGIITRSVNKMFAAKRELEEYSKGTTTVEMSIELLEIYNEQVRDLLAPNAGPNGREVALKVTSNEVVGNLRVPASSEQEVMEVLALAQSRRCVKATQSNAESSRSHMVFTLHFSVTMKNGMKRAGKLNICDLAGSERLSKSGANSSVKGDLMKETKSINSSLSVLSNVIEKLQAGSSSVPFRESKLTYVLQNSLGGNSKTLAIVCCNPHAAHFHESLCSIRFAEKVNKVELKAMANFSC